MRNYVARQHSVVIRCAHFKSDTHFITTRIINLPFINYFEPQIANIYHTNECKDCKKDHRDFCLVFEKFTEFMIRVNDANHSVKQAHEIKPRGHLYNDLQKVGNQNTAIICGCDKTFLTHRRRKNKHSDHGNAQYVKYGDEYVVEAYDVFL